MMGPPNVNLSHTLWSPSDTIKDVAESLGLNNIPEEVSKALAMDVEYRMHEILEQALKFMRHSKRKTLRTDDIGKALRVLNIEPMYGYETAQPLNFKEAMIGPGQTLYFVDDGEVDFEKLINQPLPKVPREVTFTAHWLAIEGVQPRIPQNPSPSEIKQLPTTVRGSQVSNSITAATALSNDIEVKPLVKHVLSKELQLYFDRVVSALTSPNPNDEHLKQAAVTSLKQDTGLHQLVPYLIQFVSEKITHNLKTTDMLMTILSVINALLSNKTIFIEPYIHSLIPCVLTLLLAKKMGSPARDGQTMSITQYDIRDFASLILRVICDEYGASYQTLKPRVTRTLLKAFLDTSNPTGTLYGSVLGLKALGPEIIRVVILGNVKLWVEGVYSRVEDLEDRERLINAVIDTLGELVNSSDATVNGNEKGPNNDMEIDSDEVNDMDVLYERLKKRIGVMLAEKIRGQSNGNEITKAIFFGEV